MCHFYVDFRYFECKLVHFQLPFFDLTYKNPFSKKKIYFGLYFYFFISIAKYKIILSKI